MGASSPLRKAPSCPNGCPEYPGYSGRHDSYYCFHCDLWLEPKCDRERCDTCDTRPEKPSQAKI